MTGKAWTFGEIRSFFHNETPDDTRFWALFDGMMLAFETNPDEVEHTWLPYVLKMLESWPDSTRSWSSGVWWDGENGDTFPHRAHPLHAMGRFVHIEDGDGEDLVSYCCAPDVDVLVSINFSFLNDVTSDHIRRALDGLKRTKLKHLGLDWIEIDSASARALKEATHLDNLESLSLAQHTIPWPEFKEMISAPQFKNLRQLSFGDVPFSGSFPAKFQRQMLEILPHLEATLAPHNERPWHERERVWQETNPAQKTIRQRLDMALEPYRTKHTNQYPFVHDFESFGGFATCTQETFDKTHLQLIDFFPHTHLLVQQWHEEMTIVYVVIAVEDAIDEAFGPDGDLVRPLRLRAIGNSWNDPPERDFATYNGECFLQTQFAQYGLNLEQSEDGYLHLTPENHLKRTALVRFWDANHKVQPWVGGIMIDYHCTPWHEPLGAVDTNVNVRATIVWEENEHKFDDHGQLPEQQQITCMGDVVPLFRILKREGFKIKDGRWDNSFIIEDCTENLD